MRTRFFVMVFLTGLLVIGSFNSVFATIYAPLNINTVGGQAEISGVFPDSARVCADQNSFSFDQASRLINSSFLLARHNSPVGVLRGAIWNSTSPRAIIALSTNTFTLEEINGTDWQRYTFLFNDTTVLAPDITYYAGFYVESASTIGAIDHIHTTSTAPSIGWQRYDGGWNDASAALGTPVVYMDTDTTPPTPTPTPTPTAPPTSTPSPAPTSTAYPFRLSFSLSQYLWWIIWFIIIAGLVILAIISYRASRKNAGYK